MASLFIFFILVNMWLLFYFYFGEYMASLFDTITLSCIVFTIEAGEYVWVSIIIFLIK